MSDILDNIQQTTFEIAEISLISSIGEPYDIKFITREVNIYEDIFSNTIKGDITIDDAQNLPQLYRLHGNEYIFIKFFTPYLYPFEKMFRVYKISDKMLKSMSSFSFKIHFCSEEFVLNQQLRVSKSYKGMYIHDMIWDILTNTLNVSSTKANPADFVNTNTVRDIIIPNMKPFEAINWLASMALDTDLNTGFLFYEDMFGYKFKPLSSMFEQDVYKSVQIFAKNTTTQSNYNILGVDRFEIPKSFDVLEGISNGRYCSSMLKLDLLRQKVESVSYDPITNDVKLLNEFLPFNDATNRFDEGLADNSSYIRYYPSTSDDMIDKAMLQRASEFSLLNNQKMEIVMPGDSQTTVGDVLDVEFPNYTPFMDQSIIDVNQSGKYLVTAVRHKIAENKYYNYAEICKNSVIESIPSASNSEAYNEAKKL